MEESKTEKDEKGGSFLIGLWAVSFIALFFGFTIGWQVFLIAFGVFVILTPIAIYFGFAPLNIFWTFVEEGYCRAIMRGNAFHKVLMVWENHTIDSSNWEINETETSTRRSLGGLFFYGFWPFHKVYKYHMRWANLLDSGEVEEYDEELDRIRLKLDMYVFSFALGKGSKELAEDINGVPIGFDLVMPIKIVNPYKALFVYGRWLSMVIGAIKPISRRFVARYRYKEDLLDMRAGTEIGEMQLKKGVVNADGKAEATVGEDLREKLWSEIIQVFGEEAEGEREDELRVYGVAIQREGLDIMNLDPESTYRELTTKEYAARQEATVVEIAAEAKAKAEEKRGEGISKGVKKRITDAPLEALAETYGKTKEEIARELPPPTGERLAEELKELRKEARAREGMDQGAYGELNVPGGAEALFALIGNLGSKFIKPTGSPGGTIPSTYEEGSVGSSRSSGGNRAGSATGKSGADGGKAGSNLDDHGFDEDQKETLQWLESLEDEKKKKKE